MWKPKLALAAITIVCAGSAAAESHEESADGILVLDASGSMWGQIDGRHKILIARDVIGDLLSDLPADHQLGLMAYGHNRKGDCTDIEMVSEVGANREDIRKAVNSLRPLGKTPLSASVQKAAEVLRYKETAATVILISDGEETCDVDPCEVGRALEASGVDFTAHVIGFDLSTDIERAQLQCLAESTGGTYHDAADADELSDALEKTIAPAAPKEEAVATLLYLKASDLNDGPIIEEGLSWKVSAKSDGTVIYESTEDEGELELADLAQGRYVAEVNRPSDGASSKAEIFIYKGHSKTLTLALEVSLTASVRTEPQGTVAAGSDITVYWKGPEREGDWIALAEVGAPVSTYLRYKYVKTGNPVTLRMPVDLGEYEVRYVVGRPTQQLASVKIEATEIGATVTAPTEAVAGTKMDVEWTGPNYKNDWIGLGRPSESNGSRLFYTYTKRGSPLQLQTPIEPGEYEVRYITGQGAKTLATQKVTITDIAATLSGPGTAVAGSTFEVSWTGPDYKGDWLGVVKPGLPVSGRESYAYTRTGSPAKVPAPATPGEFLVKYITQKSRVLAEIPITITPATATINAPASASAGSSLTVSWAGPDYKNDYIAIAKSGTGNRDYVTYEYTKKGSPLEFTMPDVPGSYEIRYIQSQSSIILTTETINVTPAD